MAGTARPTNTNAYMIELFVFVTENDFVMPEQAGIHGNPLLPYVVEYWTPACAGVTRICKIEPVYGIIGYENILIYTPNALLEV